MGFRSHLPRDDDKRRDGRLVHGGCAARDLQVLMMIEEREDASTVAANKLHEAMLTMLHARIVCHQGQVVDALAIYDRIAQSITPESHPLKRVLGH